MTEGRPSGGAERFTDLVADVAAGLLRLVRGEVELAKAEAKAAVAGAALAVALLLAGLLLALVALNVLAAAAVAGLEMLGLGRVWSPVIVGLALILLALFLVLWALSRLKRARGAPGRSLDAVRRDFDMLKAVAISDGPLDDGPEDGSAEAARPGSRRKQGDRADEPR